MGLASDPPRRTSVGSGERGELAEQALVVGSKALIEKDFFVHRDRSIVGQVVIVEGFLPAWGVVDVSWEQRPGYKVSAYVREEGLRALPGEAKEDA